MYCTIKLASLSYALHALVQYGWTPVINAAYWAHADVVRVLLDHKCDLLLTNKDGRTALHELCRCNCSSASALLLPHIARYCTRTRIFVLFTYTYTYTLLFHFTLLLLRLSFALVVFLH